MTTQYSHRPFTDQVTGNPVEDSLAAFIIRGASAIGGSVIVTALLATFLSR